MDNHSLYNQNNNFSIYNISGVDELKSRSEFFIINNPI